MSSLVAIGAPNKSLFQIMEIGYIFSMILFFIALYWILKQGKNSILGPVLFIVNFTMEFFVSIFFPLDAGGEVISQTAQIHMALVGLMVLSSMLGLVSLWRAFRKADGWKGYDKYTLGTFILAFIFGMATVALGSGMKGLTERLVATTLGQYFFVIALKIYRTSS